VHEKREKMEFSKVLESNELVLDGYRLWCVCDELERGYAVDTTIGIV
jgi:hypothetical protein